MKKHYLTSELEIKSLDDKGYFTGYGSIFGNVDSYGDVVVKGAFKNFLNNHSPEHVKLLWQHDPQQPIGYYESINEDETGLLVKGKLLIDDVQKAREAYALLKSKALSGLSIGYAVNSDGAKYGDDGVRYLKDIKLFEISIVTFPANAEAGVEHVKASSEIKTIRDFERFLRDAGFSKQQAIDIASRGFKGQSGRSDSDSDVAEVIGALNALTKTIQSELSK